MGILDGDSKSACRSTSRTRTVMFELGVATVALAHGADIRRLIKVAHPHSLSCRALPPFIGSSNIAPPSTVSASVLILSHIAKIRSIYLVTFAL